jgi:hypothetical protein
MVIKIFRRSQHGKSLRIKSCKFNPNPNAIALVEQPEVSRCHNACVAARSSGGFKSH